MVIDYKTVIDEHLRFARKRFSHVMLQILLTDLLKNLFNIGLEDIFPGIEKKVKSKVMGLKGKTDLLYQNVVFEIKMDLDRELEDGEAQLKKYFQALYESDPQSKNVGLITNCIIFIEYIPIIKNDEVVKIHEITSLDLEKCNYKDAVLWLDAILFSKSQITPTADDLKFRFGLGSPTYAYMLQELENAWHMIKKKESAKIKLKLWNNHMEIVYGRIPTERCFLEQTFLVILVKLIVYLRIRGLENLKELDVSEALTGRYFKSFGISNLVEEGYYSWVLNDKIYPNLRTSFKTLLKGISRYDTTQIDEDLFKEIYQEIVRKEDRHRVGEYYTPEWLVELTLSEAFKMAKVAVGDKPPSILDPACGSGTFLTNAINMLKQECLGEKPSRLLYTILENVKGSDINPLAVYIARANYIFALGDLLVYKRDIISIPIYVADTFQVTDIGDISEATKICEINADGETLSVPYSVLTSYSKYTNTIRRLEEAIVIYLQEGRNRNKALVHFESNRSTFTQSEHDILIETLNTLLNLIDNDRNSVWVFILSNVLAPHIFGKKKFDLIVGNPPWISMRSIENLSYQDYVKSKVFEFQLIQPSEIQLFSNMEMATVFFNNCVSLFLKDSGTIAFVMPRSILTGALQHVNFKKFQNPRLKLIKILDFDKVTPLFNVPSCSILCKKGKENSYPVPMRIYSGELESKNLRIIEAEYQMEIEDSTYSPPFHEGEKSPYYDRFKMGARLAPRPFWFIDFVSHPVLKIHPKIPKVRTTEDSRKQAKGQWKKVELKGNVESDYIFATLLSKDLLPFGYTKIRPIIVPAKPRKESFDLLNVSSLQDAGSIHTARWLKEVEMSWAKFRSEKNKENFPSVLGRINYQKLLSIQNPSKRFILLYVASGTYIIASVIDRRRVPVFKVNSTVIKPREFVAESKTWFYESDEEDEVHYLCSILNSKILSEKVEVLQTRGLWGARDIHRRPLLFNIPLYDSANKNHIRLVKISKDLHKMVPKIARTSRNKGVSSKRRKIQRTFFSELKQVDELVKEVINL